MNILLHLLIPRNHQRSGDNGLSVSTDANAAVAKTAEAPVFVITDDDAASAKTAEGPVFVSTDDDAARAETATISSRSGTTSKKFNHLEHV